MALDDLRGRYLCESCQEVMTDDVVIITGGEHNVEMACCLRCQGNNYAPVRPQTED